MIKIIIQKEHKKSKLVEFSKKVVFCMTLLVFISAVFAGYVIITTGGNYLDSFLDYVKTVGGIAIIGYCAKICFENPQKIKKGGKLNDVDRVSSQDSSTGSERYEAK